MMNVIDMHASVTKQHSRVVERIGQQLESFELHGWHDEVLIRQLHREEQRLRGIMDRLTAWRHKSSDEE